MVVCYQNNYFTSPSPSAALAKKQIGCCGTVRHDHTGVPEDIKRNHLKLEKGDDPKFGGHSDTGILVSSWHDTKRVNVLSTVHGDTVHQGHELEDGMNRQVTVLSRSQVCAVSYNKYMSGVDRMDQHVLLPVSSSSHQALHGDIPLHQRLGYGQTSAVDHIKAVSRECRRCVFESVQSL